MNDRQTDLSKQLTEEDFTPLAKKFAAAGWPCGTAEILQVARSNASSNHWKDIVIEYLAAKAAAPQAEPPAEETSPEAPPEEQAPTKRRRRSKSSGD